MAKGEDALDVLRSIDASMKQLVALMRTAKAQTLASDTVHVATDADLDSKYGDETVRFNPRDWTGPSYKGCRFSECPADFLDLLADAYVYFAGKNNKAGAVTDKGTPKAEYDLRSESRCRGWAARVRAGYVSPQPADAPEWKAPAPDMLTGGFEDDSIPF